MKLPRIRTALVFLALTAILLVSTAATCAPEQATTSWVGINYARGLEGAPPLRFDSRMAKYTDARAYHIATTGDFNHDDFILPGRLADQFAQQQPTWKLCEILVWTSDSQPPDLGLQAWHSSPKHWACAMNPQYTNAAISAFIGDDGRTYQVMWLGGE